MATDVNHTTPNNQPVFQMLNDDAYSDEGTEFYESKNSFESAQEQLIDIFEPRTSSKVTINEQMSNKSQDRFQPIQNDDMKGVDIEEKTVETHLTLDETIDELEAQKRESERDQSIVNYEEEEGAKIEESLNDNGTDTSENVQSSQSSIAQSDIKNHTTAAQSDQSQKSSLNLLDMASSSSLNLQASLSGSLHESRSTPALSSDGESVKNNKMVDEEDISEGEEEEEDHKGFQIKDFTDNDQVTALSSNSIFGSKSSNKSESIPIQESQQIHKEITMEPTKPKSKSLRFKLVRTFYNRCIQKYHSAKTWVDVKFKGRPKYDQQLEPKSKSAENITTVRLQSFEEQRVSHSVENFSQYTASISMVEEETSSPFPGYFTPIYYNQRKTESIMSGNRNQDPSNDACSAVFNIRQLCEERFYYNPQ